MPVTNTVDVTLTGNDYIDGLLNLKKWDISSTSEFEFSFPAASSNYGVGYGFNEPANGFSEFSTKQKDAVRAILAMYAAIVPFTFTEITETDSIHAALRFANSTLANGQAWSYDPTYANQMRGDVWVRSTGSATDPDPGDFGWYVMIHEIGHALGLKHSFEAGGNVGSQNTEIVPADRDFTAWTVMTYRSYEGEGSGATFTNETWGFPTTPMYLDIQAMQYLYGVPSVTVDDVIKFNPTTGAIAINGVAYLTPGANRIFMCPPRGVKSLDLSDYTGNLDIDLRPGEWSTFASAQVALLGSPGAVDTFAPGNICIPPLYGSEVEAITRVIGGAGDDVIVGSDEDDTLVFTGNVADYSVAGSGPYTITDDRVGSPDGEETFSNVEFFEFADDTLTLNQLLNQPIVVRFTVTT